MKKLILITGSTKGLGLATAKHLVEKGYTVITTGRTITDALKQVIEEYREDIFFEPFDFCHIELIKEFIKKITKKYGRLYGLINNAALGLDGVLTTMHDSDITTLIKVNIEAPVVLTKYATRSMLLSQQGRVINISSIIANTGFNGLSVYAATKASMIGFTKSLSRELGKVGITVNAIAPGYMETAMTHGLAPEKLAAIKRRSPMGKLATTDDVAKAVAFLLSDDASMINGETITVDGGSTA